MPNKSEIEVEFGHEDVADFKGGKLYTSITVNGRHVSLVTKVSRVVKHTWHINSDQVAKELDLRDTGAVQATDAAAVIADAAGRKGW